MVHNYGWRRELRRIVRLLKWREAASQRSVTVKHLFRQVLLGRQDRNDPPVRPARRVCPPLGRGAVFYVETVEVVDAVVVVDDRDACRDGDEDPGPAGIVAVRIDLWEARWVVAVGPVLRRRLRLRGFLQPRGVAALLDGGVRAVHHGLLLAVVY